MKKAGRVALLCPPHRFPAALSAAVRRAGAAIRLRFCAGTVTMAERQVLPAKTRGRNENEAAAGTGGEKDPERNL